MSKHINALTPFTMRHDQNKSRKMENPYLLPSCGRMEFFVQFLILSPSTILLTATLAPSCSNLFLKTQTMVFNRMMMLKVFIWWLGRWRIFMNFGWFLVIWSENVQVAFMTVFDFKGWWTLLSNETHKLSMMKFYFLSQFSPSFSQNRMSWLMERNSLL